MRVECSLDDDDGFMMEAVCNGCEPDAEENMLKQLRAGARERQAELDKFRRDYW